MKLVRIRMEYVHPWPNHAGLFTARAQGFYRQAGLDVDIIADGWERGTPAELVARGEYQFASIRLGELVETRQGKNPMKALATFNQRQMGGVISLKSKNIHSFADLEGKTVAVPFTEPRLVESIRQSVTRAGADFSKVNIVHPGGMWEPDIRAVEKGQFDAVFNVLGWESYQGISPVDEIVQLSFDEVGVTPHHTYFICATDEMIALEPDTVRSFIQATQRGFEYAFAHPDQALEACADTMCHVDPEVLRHSLNFMMPSWLTDNGRWGHIQPELVDNYMQWMISGGFSTGKMADVTSSWTNEFLDS